MQLCTLLKNLQGRKVKTLKLPRTPKSHLGFMMPGTMLKNDRANYPFHPCHSITRPGLGPGRQHTLLENPLKASRSTPGSISLQEWTIQMGPTILTEGELLILAQTLQAWPQQRRALHTPLPNLWSIPHITLGKDFIRAMPNVFGQRHLRRPPRHGMATFHAATCCCRTHLYQSGSQGWPILKAVVSEVANLQTFCIGSLYGGGNTMLRKPCPGHMGRKYLAVTYTLGSNSSTLLR